MIYKKDASFSYPIYSSSSTSYQNNEFVFDVQELKEVDNQLYFTITFKIESDFIRDLYERKLIKMYLVVQSKDNKFVEIEPGNKVVSFPKQRIALNHRTTLQLQLKSNEPISLANCYDLNSFYNEFKSEVIVPKNALIGFSEIVIYDGKGKKPLELFKKVINPDLDVPFKVRLDDRLIILEFRDRTYTMDEHHRKGLINMYLYIGFSRALTFFVNSYSENGEIEDLDSLSIDNSNLLDQKLYDLMISKNISGLGLDDLDDVIDKITEKLLEKFVDSIKEVSYEDD